MGTTATVTVPTYRGRVADQSDNDERNRSAEVGPEAAPTQKYFAYGSNMDLDQMARRCPGATPAGTAVLEGWRYAYCAGVATIVPDGGQTHGLLWDLEPTHIDTLDVYEGVAEGRYRQEFVEVRVTDSGETITVLAYVKRFVGPSAPREGYAELVEACTVRLGFPDDYCRAVAALRSAADSPDLDR